MNYLRMVYTLVAENEFSPEQTHSLSKLSADICEKLGLTGRIFTNDKEALFITEGPIELVTKYFEAVKNDPLTHLVILHLKEETTEPCFKTYSTWLSSKEILDYGPSVQPFTKDAVSKALPDHMPAKLRIMVTAYLPEFAPA